VHDAEALSAAQAAGWSASPAAAKQAHVDALAAAAKTAADAAAVKALADARALVASADNSAPTRAELEEKATQLAIKFDGRTSDKALGDRIAAALEA
jgi:hypothetical protein